MDISIPTALKAFTVGNSAAKAFVAWRAKAKGDVRSLIGELRENLTYLDMVAEDEVELAAVIDRVSVLEYKRLSKNGYNFNALKRGKIANYPSLKNTDLESWIGKETCELVESIFDKINDLKLRHPLVNENKKYRWGVRVQNIRKRIWLLLKHVSS